MMKHYRVRLKKKKTQLLLTSSTYNSSKCLIYRSIQVTETKNVNTGTISH